MKYGIPVSMTVGDCTTEMLGATPRKVVSVQVYMRGSGEAKEEKVSIISYEMELLRLELFNLIPEDRKDDFQRVLDFMKEDIVEEAKQEGYNAGFDEGFESGQV